MDQSKLQQNCINALNLAIQEYGGDGDLKFPPQEEMQPPSVSPSPVTPSGPSINEKLTEPPPPPKSNVSKTKTLNVSKTCLDTTKFQQYVLKTLSALLAQLPDNTFFGSIKRFFGFTRKLTKEVSQQLQQFTLIKKNLKKQLKQAKTASEKIEIESPENKKYACTTYEILKYMNTNKRKITSKNLIRFLNAFLEGMNDESKDSNQVLSTMEKTSLKYLQDILYRQKDELSTDSLKRLNEIRQKLRKPPIRAKEIERDEKDQFHELAEGMRSLARRTRRKKGKHKSKRMDKTLVE
jgi:hypothetical protein